MHSTLNAAAVNWCNEVKPCCMLLQAIAVCFNVVLLVPTAAAASPYLLRLGALSLACSEWHSQQFQVRDCHLHRIVRCYAQ